MDNTAELESDTGLKCINTEDNAGKKKSALEVKSTPNGTDKPSEVLEQSQFTQQLMSPFHSLENKLIECHNEYSKKIDGMNSVIEVLKEKLESQQEIKSEIQGANKELCTMNARLEKIEQSLKLNGIKIDRVLDDKKTQKDSSLNTDILQTNFIEKFDPYVKEKIEVIENICQNMINTSKAVVDSSKGNHKGDDSGYSNNSGRQNPREERNEQQNGLNNTGNAPNGNHLWIVGSSVVKELKRKLMYRFKRVNITTLHDKTIRGAS